MADIDRITEHHRAGAANQRDIVIVTELHCLRRDARAGAHERLV